MSTTINAALLGAGIFATQAHLPAVHALGPQLALRAVYSRSTRSAAVLAAAAQRTLALPAPPDVYADDTLDAALPALLARPDIHLVIVALPISVQPAVVLRALAAGKHVLSEKPVAKDVRSALALIAEYERTYKPKNLVWRVAENYEAEPGYRAAAKAISDGKIGDLRFFRLSAVGYVGKDSMWYKTPWRTVPDYQGGFLLDGGVHSAALLRLLLAANPSAKTQKQPSQLTSHASLSRAHLLPHDTVTAIISTAPYNDAAVPEAGDGEAEPTPHAHGIFELSFAAPLPSRASGGESASPVGANGTIVTGSRGWLDIVGAKDAQGAGIVRVTVRTRVTSEDEEAERGEKDVEESVEVIEERVRGVEVELASFVRAVRAAAGLPASKDDDDVSGSLPLAIGDPRDALRDVAIIEASLRSGGRPIDLEALVSAR